MAINSKPCGFHKVIVFLVVFLRYCEVIAEQMSFEVNVKPGGTQLMAENSFVGIFFI